MGIGIILRLNERQEKSTKALFRLLCDNIPI